MLLDFMQKGGPVMWFILICSVLGSAVFLERLVYFHRISVRVGEFMRGLANLIHGRRYSEAQMEAAATRGPVQRVVHAAIIRHSAPRSELKDIVEEAGQLEVPRLERRLGMLATLAFLTPLLGLLGTVAGLLEAFKSMAATTGMTSTAEIGNGIYQALITTASGLAVCIPCAMAYAYLSARANAVIHDMERAGIEVVNLLVESRQHPDIIEFGETPRRSENI
ncbi:flagellar motor protein MotA [Verrucomicrobiota bacterium]|jgi:biopolymer transport protein ExbB|nr:flagellar motor protein MotA [Verrucomicrobiota bacterium]